jgi:hypothetical protein
MTRTPSLRLACRGLLGLALLGLALGCSSDKSALNAKPVQKVKGQVLVNDKPAAGAFVLFIPVNEPANSPDPRPRATTDENGNFNLSTYGDGDGAQVGEYRVTVTWPEGNDVLDRLNGRYDLTNSKLKATVTEGANDLPAFKLSR